jgi:hypothetical protein
MKESEAAERKPLLAPGKMEPMTDDRGATSQDSESQKSERSERERIGVRAAIKRHLDELSKNLDMRRHARIQADAEVEKQGKLVEIEIEKERKLAEVRGGHSTERASSLRARTRAGKGRTAHQNAERKRASRIRRIIDQNAKSLFYCRELDRDNIRPPQGWEGCPNTYVKAYQDPKWRKKIQQEKWRIGRLSLSKLSD